MKRKVLILMCLLSVAMFLTACSDIEKSHGDNAINLTPTAVIEPSIVLTFTPSPTLTPVATSTSAPTPTITVAPTSKLAPTLTVTPTSTPTNTPMPMVTPTPSPTVLPTSTPTPTPNPTPTPSPTPSVIASGRIEGKDISWKIEGSTLTISGKGSIPNYVEDANKAIETESGYIRFTTAPWAVYGEDIKRVIIETGITSIGEMSFAYIPMDEVHISGTVKNVGEKAFLYCSELSKVRIMNGVESIGEEAFSVGTLIEGVTYKKYFEIHIPQSVTTISNYFCWPKTSVVYGEKGSYCDTFCESEGYYFVVEGQTEGENIEAGGDIEGSDLSWEIKNAVLTIKGTGIMPDFGPTGGKPQAPWYEYSRYIEKAIIEDGVTSISTGAFYRCYRMRSIEIPNTVTGIGAQAFVNCASIESLAIPDSVTGIGNLAFQGCYELKEITFPDSVTSIGKNCFWQCINLKKAFVPESVTEIGKKAFNKNLVTICGKAGSYAEEWCKDSGNLFVSR